MAEKIVQTAGRDQLGSFAPDFICMKKSVSYEVARNPGDFCLATTAAERRCCVLLYAVIFKPFQKARTFSVYITSASK